MARSRVPKHRATPRRTGSRAAPVAIDISGSDAWLSALTALCRALGTPSFQERLLALLNAVAAVDHCVVFTYADTTGAGHLFTHGKMPAARAQKLAEDYIAQYHHRDPNFARLAESSPNEWSPPLRQSLPNYDPAYRNYFFDRNDLVDKASTIGRIEHGGVYCNFYRMGSSGPYSAADWAKLERVLPLVTALISAHYEILSAQGRLDHVNARPSVPSLVHTIVSQRVAPFDRLTAREREVIERIVLGYTAVGIGLDLRIAPSSVITYRRRAYAKLDIASQKELFQRCIDAAQRLRG